VRDASAQATVAVFHAAVLAYLDEAVRVEFVANVRRLPCRWISNKAASVLPRIAAALPHPVDPGRAVFAPAVDSLPMALAGTAFDVQR